MHFGQFHLVRDSKNFVSCQYWVFEMGPLLGPSLGPISPFPLAALKLDEIDQNALLPNQKTVQSDSFAPFFVRQYHNTHMPSEMTKLKK